MIGTVDTCWVALKKKDGEAEKGLDEEGRTKLL